MRRLIVLTSVLATFLFPANMTAQAEQRGTTCGLTGSATFKPGLTATPASNKFAFKGTLADCQSTGDATSGKVTAKGTANAGCVGGTAEGVATVKWDTKKKTTVKFSTVDVGASVTLTGEVTKSTEPGLGAGDTILGQLAFDADVTQCQTGLKTAKFLGQIGGGSPN